MFVTSFRASAFVLATGLTAAASAAQAQSIGYVETLGGSISSAVSYNSAGGANSLAVLGTGVFQVTLGGLGNSLNSNVQVNAVNTNGQGHYCTSDGWFSPNGVDVTADVACFDAGGNPLPADFSLFYQARTTAPASGAIAFLWANNPTNASYSPDLTYNFNSTGALNTVARSSTGTYTAFLPLLSQTGNPQVTAYGGGAARCELLGWSRYRFGSVLGTKIGVYCVSAAGVAADELFSLSYAVGTTEAAGPAATSLGAYAWANDATRRGYVPKLSRQLDTVSAGPLTAQRFGGLIAGQYSLTVPNPNDVSFSTILGMVTANGSSGEYCDQAGVNVLSGEFYMDLICYDSQGRQTDTLYTGTLITTH